MMGFFHTIPNFIEVYDNALTSNECQEIITYINSQKLVRGSLGSAQEINIEKKKDWEVPNSKFSNKSQVSKIIHDSLVIHTNKYISLHTSVSAQGTVASWGVDDYYNLQKYDPGDAYFWPHCEQGNVESCRRVLTWMFYLNTVKDGGGTTFPNYKKTLNAVEGRLLIWPAGWTHTHHGVVSLTETKYIITGWFSFLE